MRAEKLSRVVVEELTRKPIKESKELISQVIVKELRNRFIKNCCWSIEESWGNRAIVEKLRARAINEN